MRCTVPGGASSLLAHNEQPVSLGPLVVMLAENLIHVVLGEPGQLHDLGPRPDFERQHGPDILFAVSLQDEPRFVLPIQTAPIGVNQEVRAGLKKDLDGPGTCNSIVLVGYLDKKP
jgi:hypothetical protein